jgi:sphinganine C4-monooxygenase
MSPSPNITATRPTIPQQHHSVLYAHPFYYSHTPSLLPSLSDPLLAVLAPVIAYWLVAGFFHILDSSNWAWLDRYRIHDSSEVASRNRASRLNVLFAVIFQQFIQTILGILWLSEASDHVDHATAMRSIVHTLSSLLGIFDAAAAPLAYLLYWWLIPVAQMFVAMYAKSCFFRPLRTDLSLPTKYVSGWSSTHGNTFSIARCT